MDDNDISKENRLIDSFVQGEISVLVELRMGNGLHAMEVEKLVKALAACADEWENRESIPQNAIHALIELFDELYNFSLIYKEEEATRIMEAAKQIKALIYRWTKETGEIEPEKAKVIAKLLEYINEDGHFFEKLQNGKGMDERQFERIYNELESISNQIYGWETLPKVLVNMLIDLCEMDLYASQYQEQQEQAEKIYDAHERIMTLLIG